MPKLKIMSLMPATTLSFHNICSNEDPDTLSVTYPSISVCVGSGKMVSQNQPDTFHEDSETNFDNYPLLQVDFTMLDEKYTVFSFICFYEVCKFKLWLKLRH